MAIFGVFSSKSPIYFVLTEFVLNLYLTLIILAIFCTYKLS